MDKTAHHRAETAERAYRVVDGIYRLHRDLFAIEAVIARTAHVQVRLAKQSVNGRMAALVAGMLVIVPILVSLGDIKWGSTPAIAIYVLTSGVLVLWLWQAYSAGHAEKSLLAIERETTPNALEDREDYVLEEINASVTRHRLIRSILESIEEALLETVEPSRKTMLTKRHERYQEILQGELEYVQSLAAASLDLVNSGKKTSDDHDTLLEWCNGLPGFKAPTL